MVSLCSGSEISFVTAMALCEVLQVGKVSQVMSCKADVRKQGFITEVIHNCEVVRAVSSRMCVTLHPREQPVLRMDVDAKCAQD